MTAETRARAQGRASGTTPPRARARGARRARDARAPTRLKDGHGVRDAGAALDAVTRGLSTGMLAQRDWASGTSSRSSKLVHGGIRYLEQLDFRLVREALIERGLLLQRLALRL